MAQNRLFDEVERTNAPDLLVERRDSRLYERSSADISCLGAQQEAAQGHGRPDLAARARLTRDLKPHGAQ